MKTATIITIETILEADRTIPKTKREKVMDILLDRAPPPLPMKKRLLTAKQAGEIIGVHPATLRRYEKQGKINVLRITSRKVRYDYAEVIAFANEDNKR